MNDQPKSKWHWRLPRWGLIGLAVLTTLVGIVVTEENWRGKHAWAAYQRAAAARGERLDVASVIPPPVPDDQNFFCAPIVAEALAADYDHDRGPSERRATNTVNRMDFNLWRGGIAVQIKQGGNWQKATLTGLQQWQAAFRDFSATPEGKTNGFPVPAQPQTPAADVLLALGIFDPALEELRQASLRPQARIPLDYENDFDAAGELLPWLANTKRCAQFLELRTEAELQDHQPGPALADTKLLMRVNDSLRGQPFLISQLVRMAIMAITIQPIYEGLAQHAWSEAQLVELQAALAGEDFLADYQSTMRAEKLFAIDTFEKQRITREMKYMDDSSGTNRIVTISLRKMPDAYFYQNELAFAQLNEQFTSSLVDPANRTVSPAALNRLQADVQARLKHYSLYKVQALMNAPAIASAIKKFAYAQSSVDLARVACALERFHLAHGEYPASLDALAPQFLDKVPTDIINGQPLRYHPTDDGRFVLYSVGWNEKDDGGIVTLTKNGSVDRDNGDWVWQYPAK